MKSYEAFVTLTFLLFFTGAVTFPLRSQLLADFGMPGIYGQYGLYFSTGVFAIGSFVSLRKAYYLSEYARFSEAKNTEKASRAAANGKLNAAMMAEATKYLAEFKARPRLLVGLPIAFMAFEFLRQGATALIFAASHFK